MIRTPWLWLVLTGIAAATMPAHGQEDVPPLPDRKPAHIEAPGAETEEAAVEVEPNLTGDKPTVAWEDPKIAAAVAACKTMLDGLAIDYEPLPPIKKGLCGTPAPILVKSIGADPAVAIEPPATMTCTMAVKLDAWLKEKVQPAASVLGSNVVKLRNASSYKCRNRYGGANTRISEHALANALDISAFVFASGLQVKVLGNWSYDAHTAALLLAPTPPSRNPQRVAAALEVQDAASGETTGAIVPVSTTRSFGSTLAAATRVKTNPFVRPSPPPVARPPQSPLPQAPLSAWERHAQIAARVKSNPFVSPWPAPSVAPLERDEVPTVEAAPETEAQTETETSADSTPRTLESEDRSAFLRAVHDDACKLFGTVLGPEANEAHKDHFHLDMKVRRYVKICE